MLSTQEILTKFEVDVAICFPTHDAFWTGAMIKQLRLKLKVFRGSYVLSGRQLQAFSLKVDKRSLIVSLLRTCSSQTLEV